MRVPVDGLGAYGVSDEISLVPVVSGVNGMSSRQGLKTGGRSPSGRYHMGGYGADWVADLYDRNSPPKIL